MDHQRSSAATAMGLPETWTSMGAVSMRRRGVCRARRLGHPVVGVHASPGHGLARVRMRMAARRSADPFQARLESSKNVPATTPLTRHETRDDLHAIPEAFPRLHPPRLEGGGAHRHGAVHALYMRGRSRCGRSRDPRWFRSVAVEAQRLEGYLKGRGSLPKPECRAQLDMDLARFAGMRKGKPDAEQRYGEIVARYGSTAAAPKAIYDLPYEWFSPASITSPCAPPFAPRYAPTLGPWR
jgi:hypothetical protein